MSGDAPKGTGKALPPVDFCTLVLSLGSSAMVHLGEIDHPESGGRSVDLVMAQQSIDLLAMLEEKTKGNLNEQEEQYLTSLLYEVRMRFVEVRRQQGK